ncbi:MAG: RNA polymerase sigma factor [Clostridium sp.]|uniref:RNA polymerase sigma factor n=1 Tax=Clostridium sp. TaxID=1506 RepID=UPI003D6D2F04
MRRVGLTDEELVKEIINGNKCSMEVLVNRYYKLVFSFIYRTIGEYHISLDLTQDTFMKVIKGSKTFDYTKGKFKNWILKVAMNVCKDYWKSAYIKNNIVDNEVVRVEDESENIVNIFERNDERRRIKDAIMTLPQSQREALILKYYHDLTIKEISSVTEANQSTVKSRLKLGVDKLKKIFSGGEESEKYKRKI